MKSVAIIASTALAFAPSVLANYTPQYTTCDSSFTPFVAVNGCFTDNTGSTLPFNPGQNGEKMTVEYCASQCKASGFRLAGLENGDQCRCGSTINGPLSTDGGCTSKCSGNSAQTCGGANRMNIYRDPTFPAFNPNTAAANYVSKGCYTEVSGRTLPVAQESIFGSGMSVDLCLSTCGKQGYAYAAVQYGSECYCGGRPAPNTALVSDSECSMQCPGNDAQNCGGVSRINMYYNSALDSTSPCGGSAATTTAPVTPASTPNSGVCWMTLGVYSDGGAYCVQPLPEFNNQGTCQTAATQCRKSFQECKEKTTGSGSSCLTLFERCNVLSTCCDNQCAPDANGKVGSNCNKNFCSTWDGMFTATSPVVVAPQTVPVVVKVTTSSTTPVAVKYTTTPVVVYNTPIKATNTPVANYNTPVKSTTTPVAYYNAPAKSSTTPVAYSTPIAYNTPVKVTPTSTAPAHVKNLPTVGICSIPAAYATPIGGYEAHMVACNDLSDYTTKPWKLYNTRATINAPVYAKGQESQACQAACSMQYNSCTKDYAASLNTYSSTSAYKVRRGQANTNEKRTWWWAPTPVKETYASAMTKCYNQRAACYAANSYVAAPRGTCGAQGVFSISYNVGNTYNY